MKAPSGWEDMSDEELLAALEKDGYDSEAAQYILDTLRGNIDTFDDNGQHIYDD